MTETVRERTVEKVTLPTETVVVGEPDQPNETTPDTDTGDGGRDQGNDQDRSTE